MYKDMGQSCRELEKVTLLHSCRRNSTCKTQASNIHLNLTQGHSVQSAQETVDLSRSTRVKLDLSFIYKCFSPFHVEMRIGQIFTLPESLTSATVAHVTYRAEPLPKITALTWSYDAL